MIGWPVDTAPLAIMFSSRIRRVNATSPRRNRNPVFGMDFLPLKHISKWVCMAAIAWIGWNCVHRGLWLDEAWVANSIRAQSLAEMFWDGEWLQTSPPLFLLIARGAVGLFGFSTEILRAVPLMFSLLAAVGMWGAARRVAPAWSALAVAALVFPEVAVEYFTSFKQYAGEAAAVACVLWALAAYDRLGASRFTVLVTASLALAYPMAFLLPGLAWFVFKESGHRCAVIFSASTAAMLALLYVTFIRPNVEPSLWTYWSGNVAESYDVGLWLWLTVAALLTVRAYRLASWREFACALPCLLLAAAELTGWYPASPRMRLFIRPCFILAFVAFLEAHLRWERISTLAAITVALIAASKDRSAPFEDYPAAVAYLQSHVIPGEVLIVHPNARQGLRLYADMSARFGSTGWPCCARGRSAMRSTEATVQADILSLIPNGFSGRVWLFYANRPLHWQYTGVDEGDLWRRTLWEHGCPPDGYVALPNLAISPHTCREKR
jgi:hypothetical protein